MKPLVYDFGRLDDDTEYRYILQIVQNHVSFLFDNSHHVIINVLTALLQLCALSDQFHDSSLCKVIGDILTESQRFMRKSEVGVLNTAIVEKIK